jgi:large subunit ribosomal protein L29
MDVKELAQLTADELADKEKQFRQELFNLRFQMGTGRLENPMLVRKAKRDIARVKTIMRQVIRGENAARPKTHA